MFPNLVSMQSNYIWNWLSKKFLSAFYWAGLQKYQSKSLLIERRIRWLPTLESVVECEKVQNKMQSNINSAENKTINWNCKTQITMTI